MHGGGEEDANLQLALRPPPVLLADPCSLAVGFLPRRLLCLYRARKNGLQNVISTTQAGLGRLV